MGWMRSFGGMAAALALLVAGGPGCRGRSEGEVTQVPPVQQQPAGPQTQRSVLVLCYHAMSPGAEATYDTPTEDFAAQLKLISDQGFESVTVSRIADYLEGKADLPERAVCFTFDDGPESVLTVSKPMMDQYGFAGTVFLISDAVGGEGKLTWEQVRELEAAGWEVGSHTASHEHVTRLDADTCRQEFAGSKAAIEEHIEGECAALAYPYGLYDAATMALAREAGYRLAFTIDRGPADWTDDPMRVPRQMVVNGNSLKTFGTWLAQSKLHLEQIDPPIGERVSTTTPTITARIADEDVPVDGVEISRDGKPVSYHSDATTRTITFTPELSEGANNLRINFYGSPRREISWVIVCEPG
ncbi:MAG: polysaccharide deacetylase family protein [Armatimonadota bacterium]